MSLSKSQAQTSIKNLHTEIFSLEPSALISLWEIDARSLLNDKGIYTDDEDRIFRFHNTIKLLNTSIYWNDQEYVAAPIQAIGFEFSTKGTLPTPKLSISVNEEGILALALLKDTIKKLDDLNGVKVTRRRVFAKYIDAVNFPEYAPDGFAPDPNMQFSPDIYYVDRKSIESKSIIEFELAPLLDTEGLKLPARVVTSRRCPWSYRGEGCLYEYDANRSEAIHGTDAELLASAPPVANDKDELIYDVLGDVSPLAPEEYLSANLPNYVKGSSVWIQKNGLKYYFVSKVNSPSLAPPNIHYWVADHCSKTIRGCKLRWKNINDGSLPFGGFPGVI